MSVRKGKRLMLAERCTGAINSEQIYIYIVMSRVEYSRLLLDGWRNGVTCCGWVGLFFFIWGEDGHSSELVGTAAYVLTRGGGRGRDRKAYMTTLCEDPACTPASTFWIHTLHHELPLRESRVEQRKKKESKKAI